MHKINFVTEHLKYLYKMRNFVCLYIPYFNDNSTKLTTWLFYLVTFVVVKCQCKLSFCFVFLVLTVLRLTGDCKSKQLFTKVDSQYLFYNFTVWP